MARRRRNDSLLDVIPALGAVMLLPLLPIPGGQQIISAIGGLFMVGAIIAVLIVVGFVAYRLATRPAPVDHEADGNDPFRLEARTPTTAPVTRPPATTHKLVDQLRAMDWFQFEQIIALIYRKSGFHVERRGGANPDGGIDLVLVDSNRERIAVQCKHWRSWNVGVKAVREFVGAMKIAGINKGILITLRGYSTEARQTAAANQIELLDETGLLRLLESTQSQLDSEVLQLLEDKRKLCPKCESELVLRTASKGPNAGGQFWGCKSFPRCRYVMPLR